MDVREKLMELIRQCYLKYSNATDGRLADHLIAHGVTVQEWISVKDRLPEERDTIFAKVFGADGRLPGMFLTTSDDVIVAVTYEDGTRLTKVMCTREGKWNLGYAPGAKEVTHWMPLPEPPEGVTE